MKKPLIFALLIALVLLPACGPAETTSSARVEVIWYVRQDAVEQQWQSGVITDFESNVPGIKIRLEVAAPEEFDTRMQVLAAAGTPPDVFTHGGASGFMDYVARDLAADLTPLIVRDEYHLDDFEPYAIDPFVIEGRVYGLPMQTMGSYIFYNKDLFDQAGVAYPTTNWDDTAWTYEAFLEKCALLTDVTAGVYGCSLNLEPNDAYAWLWGQDLYPAEAFETGFTDTAFLDQPAVIEAFQKRQEIVWEHRYMPDLAGVEPDVLTDAVADALYAELFASQKIAMLVTGGWGWRSYRGLHDFRWGAAALPYAVEGRAGVNFTDPWMLSAQSKHPEEAWAFLKYLAEPATQASWMAVTGAPPARTSLAEQWYKMFSFMDPAHVKQVHTGALAHGRETPAHMLVQYRLIDRILSAALEPVFNNEKDAARTLPDANPRLIEALKQIRAEYQKALTPTPTSMSTVILTVTPTPSSTVTIPTGETGPTETVDETPAPADTPDATVTPTAGETSYP